MIQWAHFRAFLFDLQVREHISPIHASMGIWFSWYNIPLALISLSWKGLAFDSPFLHNFFFFLV